MSRLPAWGVMPQLLGQKLRYLRQKYRLTQVELASQLALSSYTHITKLEADQRTPSLDLVIRMATVLKQSTEYFLRDAIPIETPVELDQLLEPNTAGVPQLFGPK